MNLFRGQNHNAGPTLHETAAGWLLREEEGRLSPADRARLDAWLDIDPAHRQALDDVRVALVVTKDGAADPQLMAMRTHALAVRPEPVWTLPRAAAATVAAIAVAGAGWMLSSADPGLSNLSPGMQMQPGDPNTAVYRTAVGERAVVSLPDGSVATLDTNSELKVAYTGAERGVRLLRGQALFEVAKHKSAPFQVYAGSERVTAVGTKFNVRLDGPAGRGKVSVALLEGVVKVSPASPSADRASPRQTVTMAAGEVLEAKAAAPIVVAAADTDRLASWRSGELVFNDAPLGEAIAEMNRYTTRPITLSDPKLGDLRISGVFKTGDPEHFAETVSEAFPVNVVQKADGSSELEPRG